jgi:hypothetical protein
MVGPRLASLALALAFAIALAACHGSGNAITVRGQIAGVTFVGKDAYATESSSPIDQPPPRTYSLAVVVTGFANACAVAPGMPAGSTIVEVSITRAGGAVVSGTYGADGGVDGLEVTALLERADEGCQLGNLEVATGGTVTVDIVQPTEVRGTVSLHFPDGTIEGNFVAPFCGGASDDAAVADDAGVALDASFDGETTPLCVP